MGKVITVFNQKGGVGKTVTSINLSASLGELGKKILLIDMDPQGNLTSGLGIEKEADIYRVILGEIDIQSKIQETEFKNIDIIAGNRDLAGLEIELVERGNWNNLLKEKVDEIKEDYDYIFIDSPPSLGILSMLSLVATDYVLIPMQPEYYALEGLSDLYGTIDLIKDNLNPDIKVHGILLTMYDGRNNLTKEVEGEVRNFFEDLVYKEVIPRNVRLAEAPSYGQPITVYDPKSTGGEAYLNLAKEFLDRK